MGCFLDCFGLKDDNNNNKKRRFSGKKSPSQEQERLSYVPLDSDVSINLDNKENGTSDPNQLKENKKEAVMQKIKKKVRFNLNVKAYEPIPRNEDEDEDEHDDDDLGTYFSEGTKSEFNVETKSMASLHYEEENAIASSISTHRYQNCIQNYDEEDYELMMLHENDLNFDEIEHDDDGDENDDATSEEDFSREFKSDYYYYYNDDVTITSPNLETSVDRLLIGRKSSGRDRSKYVCSVLNPVENLSQWKAVKAKGVISTQYMCEKENF